MPRPLAYPLMSATELSAHWPALVYAGIIFVLCRAACKILRGNPLSLIPGPPSTSLLSGNLHDVFNERAWDFHKMLSEEYGPICRLTGLFGSPCLYVYDPTALYSILIKEQDSYDKSEWQTGTTALMLGKGLLAASGDMHRKQRRMLNPVFSAKHLKDMVPIINDVAETLVTAISARVTPEGTSTDILNWMGRASLELIGRAGIGYSFDPLVEDNADDYADAVKHYMPHAMSALVIKLRQAAWPLRRIGPKWAQRKVVDAFPSRAVRRLMWIVDVLDAKSREIYEAKKVAAAEKGGVGDGKDIMSILMRANLEAAPENRLPEDQVIGQISTIIFAAMDTTSCVLARILHLLAERPEMQERLRREVRDVSDGGAIEYDDLQRMSYMDSVCKETLRLYAPVPTSLRQAVKDTVLPLSEPITGTNGSTIREIPVPRGTNIFLSNMNCNTKKDVWGEDALEWKPERWLQPLRPEVENAGIPGVYSHMMSFMGGNRSCIGFTFAQLEMKVILALLIRNFAFEMSDKPIVWNLSGTVYPTAALGSTTQEMWLKVRKVQPADV